MTYLIRAVMRADGSFTPEAERWLESCDHDVGRYGLVSWCTDIRRAMQFVSQGEAWDFWLRQSRTNPVRPDGKANRPLTAWTVTILPMEDYL